MDYTTSYFPLIVLGYGPPIGVRFRESLVVRLHSEIDQIHLSIQAQCVTTLLPLGDCHNDQTHQQSKSCSFGEHFNPWCHKSHIHIHIG